MIKITENNGVYIIQLRPETIEEKNLLRDAKKAERGKSEYDYWDVKPKEKKDFMDGMFTLDDSEEENPFMQEPSVKEEKTAEPETVKAKEPEYVQQEIEWEK